MQKARESQRQEESKKESVPGKSPPHQEEKSHPGSKEVTITDELRDKIEKLENQAGPASMRNSKSGDCPFSSFIVIEPLPAHYKYGKIPNYDGSGDPEKYLARFENLAMLHCYGDIIKCKVFLTALVDSAQRCFEKLEPDSICSFKYFQFSFLQHFSSSKRHKKTTLACLK